MVGAFPPAQRHSHFCSTTRSALWYLPDPEGRKLCASVRLSQTPIEKKPGGFVRAKTGENYRDMRSPVSRQGAAHGVAQAGTLASTSNWQDREATFLLGGALCTHRWSFCDIATGRPTEYDKDETRAMC